MALEPESEKIALSPNADLDEIREFLRSESLERTQLCMRLQKQQELLELLVEVPPLKKELCQEALISKVDSLKSSLESAWAELRELQESTRSLKPSTQSMVLHTDKEDREEQACELDRSFKVQSDASEAYEGDMPWLDERLEELQRQIGMEMNSQEERLEEEFVNLKGFVDAAIVAMVSRLSSLEIFVKGEAGLSERLEALKTAAEEANPLPRLKACEKQMTELNDRLATLERRPGMGQDRPIACSPPLKSRTMKPKGIESNDSAVIKEVPEAISPQRVLHGIAPSAVPLLPGHGSLKVPSWQGVATSSQLVSVLATPRLVEVAPGVPGRSPTPSRGYLRAPVVVRY